MQPLSVSVLALVQFAAATRPHPAKELPHATPRLAVTAAVVKIAAHPSVVQYEPASAVAMALLLAGGATASAAQVAAVAIDFDAPTACLPLRLPAARLLPRKRPSLPPVGLPIDRAVRAVPLPGHLFLPMALMCSEVPLAVPSKQLLPEGLRQRREKAKAKASTRARYPCMTCSCRTNWRANGWQGWAAGNLAVQRRDLCATPYARTGQWVVTTRSCSHARLLPCV